MGFFDTFKLSRLKEGLAKTRENIVGKIQKLLTSKSKIDDELLDNLEEILIAGDVGVATTMKIIDNIKERVKKDKYENPTELDTLLRDEIQKMFLNGEGVADDSFALAADHKPHVIMIVGVNGVGKTTTIGKLAQRIKDEGNDVLICAADTFRAAANDQLEIWAQRAGVQLVQQKQGTDPAAVLFDALAAAKARNTDVLIVDTAGRLHNKANLMAELEKMKRISSREVEGAPHETLLVIDAVTGQNGLEQARQFMKTADVTGIVLTKLDGTAKGGIAVAIAKELNLPIRYVGIGEQVSDLMVFDPESYVNGLFN